MLYETEQEDFWAGEFGTDYIERSQGSQMLASNINFFSHALRIADNIHSCIEFGANIGMNMKALKLLYPKIDLYGVEINKNAAESLSKIIPKANVFNTSILHFNIDKKYDITFTKGVLIHINPDHLNDVYDKLASASNRYILLSEYYNPSPVSVKYRGHDERLFKRDFAGEIMSRYPEFKLIDYGFFYRNDNNFPMDDMTWFLLEK